MTAEHLTDLRVEGDLTRFEADARGGSGVALAVFRPRTLADVRAVIRWAREIRARLVTQGANSGLVGASTPDATGTMAVLSTELLTARLDIDPLERTATVSAGVRLSTLNEAARPFGLFFPIDLGADPSLGGMVSTNTGGAKLVRYGDVRHNLLGLEVVLADEPVTVVQCGRGLAKDNTGLDLKQVFVGTGGTLGVVTEVTVRLHPLPRSSSSALVATSGIDAAVALFQAVNGPTLAAFEVVSANALRLTLDHLGERAPFADGLPRLTVLIEFADDDVVDRLAPHAASFDDFVVLPVERAWAIRHRVTEALRAAGAVVAFDVSVRRADVGELVERTRGLLPDGCELCEFGHLGDGGLHLNVVRFAGPLAEGELQALRVGVFGLVAELGGSASAEHGVGPRNREYVEPTVPESVHLVHRLLKARFDPLDLLGR